MGVVTGADMSYSGVTGEAVPARAGEVVVKDPKQISTGLARMAAMLARRTTLDRATILHSEFPIAPT
jgi:hypothetical protein